MSLLWHNINIQRHANCHIFVESEITLYMVFYEKEHNFISYLSSVLLLIHTPSKNKWVKGLEKVKHVRPLKHDVEIGHVK